MGERHLIRVGTVEDLEALVRLERAAFAADAFSREQLRHLLSRANATVFVLEAQGRVCGSAVMLWRSNSRGGRLYSISVDPAYQGRGLGAELLGVCEDAALKRGCRQVSLEVRADNGRAIGFYERSGYRVADTLRGYYDDGMNGLRMVRELEAGESSGTRLEVPYYGQTLEFTCGPACVMMAMKYFDPWVKPDRSMELMIWKEATTIFMTSGLGGCGPFGMALAARRRGFQTRVILSDRETPFLNSVRSPEKRDVIRLVHQALREEALAQEVAESYSDFGFEEIATAIRNDEVPIVLISTYRLHRVRAPHWVVVTGFNGQHVYFHDPYEGFYTGRAQHVQIPISEFRRMRRYGKALHKSAVFVGKET